MTQTINVNLGVTLCTDPENRNFIRMGIEAQGIDIDGNIQEQAQAHMTAAIEVISILNDGLTESIVEIVSMGGKEGLVKETLETHTDQIGRIGRALRVALGDIATLKALPEPSDDTPEEASTVADETVETPEPVTTKPRRQRQRQKATAEAGV